MLSGLSTAVITALLVLAAGFAVKKRVKDVKERRYCGTCSGCAGKNICNKRT